MKKPLSVNEEMGRREFLKRGSLAGVVATTGLLPLEPIVREESEAVASGVDARGLQLEGRELDSEKFALSMYERTRPALGFTAGDMAAAKRWQRVARGKLTELVGGFPDRVDLRPEVLERTDHGSYTRERIVFQTRDNLSAIGWLLLPKGRSGRVPTVVCLPGHGRGADDIVGITEDGRQRTEKAGYARDFAIQAVERGYAAFALELLAFGQRRDAAARRKGPAEYSCRPAAGVALLLGQSMVGWRVWDTMVALDYLSTRPEVDPERFATMGISGGGTVSLFTAALDERVKVAVVSGYFNTFRDSIVTISHCMDNYVPGLLNQMEMYDLAGLVAPRCLFVESGTEDRIFPVQGSRVAVERAREIYRVFGAPDRVAHEVFDGGHEFHGRGAFEFLSERL